MSLMHVQSPEQARALQHSRCVVVQSMVSQVLVSTCQLLLKCGQQDPGAELHKAVVAAKAGSLPVLLRDDHECQRLHQRLVLEGVPAGQALLFADMFSCLLPAILVDNSWHTEW